MTAIITHRTRIFNAEQLIKSFTLPVGGNNHYLFIGKPLPWAIESAPDTPLDMGKMNADARRDMMAVKRIQASNVSLGIVNRTWTTGQYYDMYRNDYDGSTVFGVDLIAGTPTTPASLYYCNFYVITSQYNIYKCIWNAGGMPSTISPSGTSTTQFTTADGYIWKFMGTVSPADTTAFFSANFCPVKKVGTNPGTADFYYSQYQVEQAAVDGSINYILVTTGGTGFPVSSITVPITITGDGIGATATGSTNSSGQLISVNITSVGSGYTYANIIAGGGGTGSVIIPVISPKYGHGYDITRELGAYYVLIDVTLQYAEAGNNFPTNISYRRLGIIKDPYIFGTTTVASSSTYNACKSITFTSATGTYLPAEIITGTTSAATGVVVSYDPVGKVIQFIQTSAQSGTFVVGENVTGGTSVASGIILSTGNPGIIPTSGELLYLEHRRAINRAPDQIEDIKITIQA